MLQCIQYFKFFRKCALTCLLIAVFLIYFMEIFKLFSDYFMSSRRCQDFDMEKLVIGKTIPYMAFLQITAKSSKSFHCMGTLINSDFVLTTAHCLCNAKTTWIHLGVHNIIHRSLLVLESQHFKIHPLYTNDNYEHDVGLIVLPQTITMNDFIYTITLPSKKFPKDYYSAKLAKVLGWGSNNIPSMLLEKSVMILDNELCALYYHDDKTTLKYISEFKICAYGSEGPCHSDSGGPLLIDGVQIGIVSFGEEGCKKTAPSVYTRIDRYLPWIIKNSLKASI